MGLWLTHELPSQAGYRLDLRLAEERGRQHMGTTGLVPACCEQRTGDDARLHSLFWTRVGGLRINTHTVRVRALDMASTGGRGNRNVRVGQRMNGGGLVFIVRPGRIQTGLSTMSDDEDTRTCLSHIL